MSFSIIAAIGKNRELGKSGKLLWNLPDDLAFFKKTTSGHPILMGHRTFDSLPKMLPGRKHLVVTRVKKLDTGPLEGGKIPSESLELINNLPQFISENQDSAEEIFVIGGGMVYWEMLKYADKIYLTEVDAADADADTFFPEFDKTEYSREILGKGENNGIKFTFVRYQKLN